MLRRRSPWGPASSPIEPPAEACALVTVDRARLTPFQRGPVRDVRQGTYWISGAVHDAEGVLVRESQRQWAGDALMPAASDPKEVRPNRKRERLTGTWLYAGHQHLHFGHVLLEGLTNLWPEPDSTELAGIVVHRNFRGRLSPPSKVWKPRLGRARTAAWAQELQRLAGYGDVEVKVARRGMVEVERLVVPERPVLLKGWARPEAVAVWKRIAAQVPSATEERVFLSRRRFHESAGEESVRTTREWDARLEQMFTDAGFTVVHPETLPITEQIALARGARVLAGSSGSALHLSAFADRGTSVLEIGDARTDRPLRNQRIVDAACGHRTAFTHHGDEKALAKALATI